MNIYSAIKEGTEILNREFIESAQIDSEILLAKVMGKDRKYILLNQNHIINEKNLITFKKLIKERSNRRPVAHIIKKKFFWDSEFQVTSDTLIPRPDSEIIVDNVEQNNSTVGGDVDTKTGEYFNQDSSSLNLSILLVLVFAMSIFIYLRTRVDDVAKI